MVMAMVRPVLAPALVLAVLAGAAGMASAQPARVELREGESVDVGDRQVLITFDPGSIGRFGEGSFALHIAGSGNTFKAGAKVDLKRYAGALLANVPSCTLEVVDLVAPKGAPATATLSLACGGLALQALPAAPPRITKPSSSPPAKIVPVRDNLHVVGLSQSLAIMPHASAGSPVLTMTGFIDQRRARQEPRLTLRIDIDGRVSNTVVGEGDRQDLRRYGQRDRDGALATVDQCFVDVIRALPEAQTAVLRVFCQ